MRYWAIVGLFSMLVLAACGGSSIPNGGTDPEVFSSSSAAAPPPALRLPPADGSSGVSEPDALSAHQTGVLADGEVSFAEYEASVLAHLACLEDAGVRTSGPNPSNAGLMLTWSMTPPPGMSDDEFLDIEARCLSESLDVVEEVYAESIRPDERMLQEYAENLRVCLNDAGADLEEGLTEQEIIPRMLELTDRGESGVTSVEMFACFDLYALSVG